MCPYLVQQVPEASPKAPPKHSPAGCLPPPGAFLPTGPLAAPSRLLAALQRSEHTVRPRGSSTVTGPRPRDPPHLLRAWLDSFLLPLSSSAGRQQAAVRQHHPPRRHRPGTISTRFRLTVGQEAGQLHLGPPLLAGLAAGAALLPQRVELPPHGAAATRGGR